MKTGLSVLAVSFALIGFSYGANAADLINEDDVAHVVIVDGETEVSVDPKAEVIAICETCTVQLEGVDEPPVEVGESSSIVINQGVLSVDN